MGLQLSIKQSFVTFVACFITAFLATSCGNVASDTTEEDVFHAIVEEKWSRDPYLGPDGSCCDINKYPSVDYYQYYAFNRDSTVDYFWQNATQTGTFSVEGNLVTCSFVDEVDEMLDSVTANDGDFNSKVFLKYKNNKLYLYDKLKRHRDNNWVSTMDPEYRELYYKNAGRYVNDRYNTGDFYHEKYDTTVDAMTVVERYNWRRETYYKNGKRDGLYKVYQSGKLVLFGNYAEGLPTGVWYVFYPLGDIKAELTNIRSVSKYEKHGKYVADAIVYLFGKKENSVVFFDDETGSYWSY